jgi:hypothetical protein
MGITNIHNSILELRNLNYLGGARNLCIYQDTGGEFTAILLSPGVLGRGIQLGSVHALSH